MNQSHTSQTGMSDLSGFDNSWYKPGGSVLKRILWYFTNALFFKSSWFLAGSAKVSMLRLFGAKVGKGLVIKPCVNIKYPWRLSIGDYCWLGENVWIDNLADVKIGNHVCISQGAMLLTGNHNYKVPSFDLMIGEIQLEDGAWIGAQTTVCPGITAGNHSVLSVGSVATSDLEPFWIYQGVPAEKRKERIIES